MSEINILRAPSSLPMALSSLGYSGSLAAILSVALISIYILPHGFKYCEFESEVERIKKVSLYLNVALLIPALLNPVAVLEFQIVALSVYLCVLCLFTAVDYFIIGDYRSAATIEMSGSSATLSFCRNSHEAVSLMARLTADQRRNLQSIKFTHSCTFQSLPEDFFAGCEGLREARFDRLRYLDIPPSFKGCLELRYICFNQCNSLASAPSFEGCAKLEQVIFSHCINLNQVPSFEGYANLFIANFEDCTRLAHPPSFKGCTNLSAAYFNGCLRLLSAPNFEGCAKLEQVIFSHCISLNQVPSFEGYANLFIANFDDCRRLAHPPSFKGCTNLSAAYFNGCLRLLSAPNFEGCKNLRVGDFHNCRGLVRAPDFSSSKKLQKVDFGGCISLTSVQNFDDYTDLEFAFFTHCMALNRLPNFTDCTSLKRTNFSGCWSAHRAPIFKGCRELEEVNLSCSSIQAGPDLEGLANLRKANFSKSFIESPPNLIGCQHLEDLDLSKCRHLNELPDLSDCIGLRRVEIEGAGDLRIQELTIDVLNSRRFSLWLEPSPNTTYSLKKLAAKAFLKNATGKELQEIDYRDLRTLLDRAQHSGQVSGLLAKTLKILYLSESGAPQRIFKITQPHQSIQRDSFLAGG